MKIQTIGCVILSTLLFMSEQTNATPAPDDICVGSPWAICWSAPVGIQGIIASTFRVKSKNGVTYNNVRLSWAAEGSNVTPTVISHPNCSSGSGTEATGCTIYPESSGIITGVGLSGPTVCFANAISTLQYLNVTVQRQNNNGTYVNMMQARIGPLYLNGCI